MSRLVSRVVGLIIFILASLVPTVVRADPRLVLPDDPQGNEVRAAARDFLNRIADGDAGGAKALFDGPADQAELLDAHLRLVASSGRFQKALTARFGEPHDPRDLSMGALFRARAERQSGELLMMNGDSASVAGGVLLNTGLDLRRTAGGWRVTHLTVRHHSTPAFLEFLTTSADAMDRAGRTTEAGGFDTAAAANRAVSEQVLPVTLKFIGPDGPVAKPAAGRPAPPDTRPAAPPAPPAPSAADLRGLLGKSLLSDEVRRLIAALPGTPHVSGTSTSVSINSEAAGLWLVFESPDAALKAVHLLGGGTDGFSRYPNELPDGLAFGQDRRQVEERLGRPATSAGGTTFAYGADYPRLGLHVGYAWAAAAKDPENPVHQVILIAPDAAASGPQTKPAAAPRLSFRLVRKDAAEGPADDLPDPADPTGRRTLAVLREPLLDEAAVADVYELPPDRDVRRPAVGMTMTADGARRLREVTAANTGRQLALVLDGRVLMAPVIRDPISDRLVIDVGNDPPTDGPAGLVGRIHAAVTALPATRPSDDGGSAH